MHIKIAVTDDRFGSYEEEKKVFGRTDVELTVLNLGKGDPIPEILLEADGILCNLFSMQTDVIEQLRNCKIISRYGVGYDNVDCEAASRKRIWVANVPDYCVEEVTDHVLALLLGCARWIVPVHKRVTAGTWNLQAEFPMKRLKGKSLGIIGFGRTGKALFGKVSKLGFGEIMICDPFLGLGVLQAPGAKWVSLPILLERSDFISVHVPLTKDTHHLVSERELAAMKEDAVIVNTSRGKVIDEAALARFLAGRPGMRAALDVFEEEPLAAESPLRSMENVILSSHLAYYSVESISELKTKAAKNILEVLCNRPPLYPVNSPK
jgi:D-3-phosphoglycerate dehydrogenase / 2-oxoglutarate reductase